MNWMKSWLVPPIMLLTSFVAVDRSCPFGTIKNVGLLPAYATKRDLSPLLHFKDTSMLPNAPEVMFRPSYVQSSGIIESVVKGERGALCHNSSS